MRRNLRFWTRYTAESAAVVAFIMAIFLGISLLGANAEYQTTVLYMTPYYLVTAAMLTILLMNYGTQATYVPCCCLWGRPGGILCWASTTTGP